MRPVSFLGTASAVLQLSEACDTGIDNGAMTNGDRPDDQTASARDQTPAGTADRPLGMQGAQGFVQQAAIGNMAEIQLGQLASQRAQSSEVKQFAQKMIQSHTKALSELKSVANNANASVPAELDDKHRDLHQRLSGLQGAEFDREYMKVMVDAHEDMADLLEGRADNAGASPGASSPSNAQSAGGDAALNQWAAKTLPEVRQHLQEAQQLQKSVDSGQ